LRKDNVMKRRDFIKTVGIGATSMIFSGCASNSHLPPYNKTVTKRPNISFQRKIPVRYEVDVFVAGGGPAGVTAALAAAGQGREVYVAEGHSCFGGMGTAGMVPAFMQFTDGLNFLAAGIGRQIYNRLKTDGPKIFMDNPAGSVAIHAESLKRVYDELMVEAGVEFTFHTNLIDVQTDGGDVSYAICSAKSGIFAVKAKVFIDATGNGDLCAWAGAPFDKGDEDGNLMPGTLCSLWADIDWEAVEQAKRMGQSEGQVLLQAIKDGVFSVSDRHLPGIWRVGERIGGGNIGHTFGVDGTDEVSLTKALLRGRKSMCEYQRFYTQYLKGYENMNLVATGSLLGVRETRRIIGDYVLCLQDFKKRAVFKDEIGRYCYPVDIHPSKPDEKSFAKFEKEYSILRYTKGQSYGIPYRILTPKKLNNVLVAGRCVSCDRYIQGSIRVMPGCFITGQAVGAAAAMAAEKNTSTRRIDVKELQQRLKDIGAFLPNA